MPLLHVPQSVIEENVFNALKEDIGEGDITAELIPPDNISLATVISREACVFCGLDWFEECYRQLDPEILIDWCVDDGDRVEPGQVLCTISGSSQNIVTGERTALNFVQTLSATATLAARYASEVEGTGAKVLDTRKTIPGLRLAQKYAVSCGGCENHRIGLYDAYLIKENHINACGGIAQAINEAQFRNPDIPVEIEVENLDELQLAITAGADRVLLDNFDLQQLKQAVNLCHKDSGQKVVTEASGNITLKNIHEVAGTGVDYISIGALTKDIRAIDLSMRFD
ncbi:MAG TPA: carboxylating nicotinate-nucleotide diphosphorylase [Gammaproteobacteria bacterium]|nr:carboxylating nicotinate-nucleotide diphosphorylase [Gammaproteobacteria bacterium]